MICKTILNFCVVHISNDENLGEFLTHMHIKSHRNHIDPDEPPPLYRYIRTT
jgi:hypothetical protein